MPVTLVNRLPLPNLKVYSAGSVVLLAVAVYHAASVTSDPAWRLNATAAGPVPQPSGEQLTPDAEAGGGNVTTTRNLTDQLVDLISFMMQEPLCMWTLINMCYVWLGVCGVGVVRAVFGPLRVSEAARLKEKLWNFAFYKFIFVFGVLNVQFMDEVLLWWGWFTLLGCLHLLATLAKDRFEYLSSSGRVSRWAHARLVALLSGVVVGGAALLGVAIHATLPHSQHTFAFMAAECLLVLLAALHVLARYSLQLYEADVAGPAYYTHLAFDACMLVVELVHVVHMVWFNSLLVSMPSLVLLMQLRHLLHELQHRLRKHRLYAALAAHMSQHYPMASAEEVEKNQDNCAICWEPMKEARKLPCSHLFHNSCLCQWVQQDASCPTCRRALRAAPAPAAAPARARAAPGLAGLAPLVANAEPLPLPRPPNHPNHLFHFDGSRYVSWLPSFSVEVTRVRAPPPPPHQLEAMATQVQQLFPQYPMSALLQDLGVTRSADQTVNNILEGRLAEPTPYIGGGVDNGSETWLETDSARHTPPISASETLQVPRVTPPPAARDAATHTEDDAPPDPAPAPAPPAPALTQDHAETGHSSAIFSKEASERETQLQRRKQELVAAARRKYLDKMSRPTNTSPTNPTGPTNPIPHADS